MFSCSLFFPLVPTTSGLSFHFTITPSSFGVYVFLVYLIFTLFHLYCIRLFPPPIFYHRILLPYVVLYRLSSCLPPTTVELLFNYVYYILFLWYFRYLLYFLLTLSLSASSYTFFFLLLLLIILILCLM